MSQFLFLDIGQLESRLDQNDGLLLVHFGSPLVASCGFTQRSLALIAPEFLDQIKFCTIDIPLQEVQILRQYSLRVVPTLLLFDGDREIERLDRILLPAELRLFFRDAVAFYGAPQPAPRNEDPGRSA
ncbi:MAG: thioredoxin family protein [Planctomycetota bacterium]|nr:thioredoxin family protein [Planctomycetota bacterium]